MATINYTSSEIPDLVYLFEIDLTFINVGTQVNGVQPRYYFYTAGANLSGPITTSFMRYTQIESPSITFYPIAMKLDGLTRDSNGKASRPKLQITKLDPIVSAIASAMDIAGRDFVGAGVTYNSKFMTTDFTNAQMYNYDFFYIAQKTSENRFMFEFELMNPFDVEHIKYPKRVVSKNTCIWEYKDSATCGWTPRATKYFDYSDQPSTDVNDRCGKRVESCRLRFGSDPLRYGGFPTIDE
jgi:lambda family phage minor tail protein L